MMKVIIFFFGVAVISVGVAALPKNVVVLQTTPSQAKVDSVLNFFFDFLYTSIERSDKVDLEKIKNLDSLAVEIEKEKNIAETLERLTGIRAGESYYYASGIVVDRNSVDKWNNWCKKNRHQLFWNYKKERIERRDYNIDSGKKN